MQSNKFALNPDNWVDLYADYLYSLALMKVNKIEVAEDLVQDTFLSAFKAKDSFKGEASEKTWLTRILNNKIIDYYRKKNPESSLQDYLDTTHEQFNEAFFEQKGFRKGHFQPLIGNYDWENPMNSQEFENILKLCISKIPPKIAPIFVAKFLEEEDTEKICKDYQISTSNYWVIIHRIKLLMRACLEKNWFRK
jgi:RNA polymerase sigma-70 factor (ECF subfamily)